LERKFQPKNVLKEVVSFIYNLDYTLKQLFFIIKIVVRVTKKKQQTFIFLLLIKTKIS